LLPVNPCSASHSGNTIPRWEGALTAARAADLAGGRVDRGRHRGPVCRAGGREGRASEKRPSSGGSKPPPSARARPIGSKRARDRSGPARPPPPRPHQQITRRRWATRRLEVGRKRTLLLKRLLWGAHDPASPMWRTARAGQSVRLPRASHSTGTGTVRHERSLVCDPERPRPEQRPRGARSRSAPGRRPQPRGGLSAAFCI
jgi:hypothetical protein